MRSSVILLILAVLLAGCGAHDPARCDGKLEPINMPAHARTAPDSNGQ
jgi:hypothetical protein